ncbi:molybdopterin dinucleotide binding domain-containing protein [Fundidesulfovibrio agrisoli]|uniref:molybdopterin dinucleotide binding domain-containing protein n=1 Tax=Fundidesulfovibrio agrisoli TaxID=2922717 RepID=UPI001FABA10E|nr:molybdopterin dinucleotide binding domain-containing protein [Fundidesulfovibrio agrisoli]
MSIDRRTVLKGLGAGAALTVFASGYKPTLKAIIDPPKQTVASGPSLAPEATVDKATGEVTFNRQQYLAGSICLGCTSICGVRVRVDNESGSVLRVSGNPYHPLAAQPPAPYEASLADTVRALSGHQGSGLARRATACGRGNAVLDKLKDPYRVLTPLKRVGPRGSGKWEPISLERLVEEISTGGDLFGEGQVEGLAALLDGKPIDPASPELGTRANQLACIFGYANGRMQFFQRFAAGAFGTINIANHQGNCGLTMRAGYAAMLGDFQEYPHLKPDYANCTFYLSVGSAPANAGNPFMYQAAHAARARAEGGPRLVVVDPVLTNSDNACCGAKTEWVPVRPGTDGALVMGMIRRILETRGYQAGHLACAGPLAAKNAGEAAWTNAAHLVVADPAAKDFGQFLRARELSPEAAENALLARDVATGDLVAHDQAQGPCSIFFSGSVTTPARTVAVKTALQLLLEEAQSKTLAEYSKACGVPQADIVRLADEFASNGRTAVADCHGGTMHAGGFYTAYAVALLNALAGNLNRKGGTGIGGGKFKDFGPGPRYNLADFPKKAKPGGVRLSRQGFPYEKTSEFKRLVESGAKPYPARAPWYPFSNSVQSEYLPSALSAYPYPLKAMLFWASNPVYGQAGLMNTSAEQLKDPKRIPLMVCVDAFMTETAALCDYVLPDVALYEGFGCATPWAGPLSKVSSVAWPCVDSPVARTPEGDPVCMESFLIALAKRLGLPGFGPEAVADAQGGKHPLERPEDWYHRAVANMAFDAKPVADATQEDMEASGVSKLAESLARVLTPEEAAKAASVYCRGGRFEPVEKGWQGELLAARWEKPVQIWNENVARAINSMTGKRLKGTAAWIEPAFCEGTPVRAVYPEEKWPFLVVSTKSQLMSAGAVGSKRLHAIRPESEVAVCEADAARLGLRTGDKVRLETPDGSVEARLTVRLGVMEGVVAVEHGYGHWALGAKEMSFGAKTLPASPLRGAGAASNLLGLKDPFRKGFSTLGDIAVGANARNALPARIVKL